jgi:hypothetical protein
MLEEVLREANKPGKGKMPPPGSLKNADEVYEDEPIIELSPDMKIEEVEVTDDMIIEDFDFNHEELGFSEESLEKLGFYELLPGQQALVIENFKQMMLAKIKEDSRREFKEGLTKKRFLPKIWQMVTSSYQVAKIEKNKASDLSQDKEKEAVLSQLIKGIKDSRIDASLEDGKIKHIDFCFEDDFGGNLKQEFKQVIEEFNQAADKLGRMPYEWSLPGADKKSQKKYREAEINFQDARNKILVLKQSVKGGDKNIAESYCNELDYKVRMTQLFNTHPEVEKQLDSIKNEWAIKRILKDAVTERGIYMGFGFATRGLMVGAMGVAGVPVAAGVIGDFVARNRAKKTLAENELMARGQEETEEDEKGRKIEDTTEYKMVVLRKYQDYLNRLEEAKREKDNLPDKISQLSKEIKKELAKINTIKNTTDKFEFYMKKDSSNFFDFREEDISRLRDLQVAMRGEITAEELSEKETLALLSLMQRVEDLIAKMELESEMLERQTNLYAHIGSLEEEAENFKRINFEGKDLDPSDIKKQLEKLQKKRQEELVEKGDVVDAKYFIESIEFAMSELDAVAGKKTELEEEIAGLKEGEDEQRKELEKEIKKLENRRQELSQNLRFLVDDAWNKLDDGVVNFGAAKNRASNKYELVRKISEANTLVASFSSDRADKNASEAYQRAIFEDAKRMQVAIYEEVKQAKKTYFKKQINRGILLSASFATFGWVARDLWHGFSSDFDQSNVVKFVKDQLDPGKAQAKQLAPKAVPVAPANEPGIKNVPPKIQVLPKPEVKLPGISPDFSSKGLASVEDVAKAYGLGVNQVTDLSGDGIIDAYDIAQAQAGVLQKNLSGVKLTRPFSADDFSQLQNIKNVDVAQAVIDHGKIDQNVLQIAQNETIDPAVRAGIIARGVDPETVKGVNYLEQKRIAGLGRGSAAREAIRENISQTGDVRRSLATVYKGEGIEHALRRQLEADPKSFGFNGDLDDLRQVHKWSGQEAHSLAVRSGYASSGVVEPGESAYVLERNNGALEIKEYKLEGAEYKSADLRHIKVAQAKPKAPARPRASVKPEAPSKPLVALLTRERINGILSGTERFSVDDLPALGIDIKAKPEDVLAKLDVLKVYSNYSDDDFRSIFSIGETQKLDYVYVAEHYNMVAGLEDTNKEGLLLKLYSLKDYSSSQAQNLSKALFGLSDTKGLEISRDTSGNLIFERRGKGLAILPSGKIAPVISGQISLNGGVVDLNELSLVDLQKNLQ